MCFLSKKRSVARYHEFDAPIPAYLGQRQTSGRHCLQDRAMPAASFPHIFHLSELPVRAFG
jgi:hypothetical protein